MPLLCFRKFRFKIVASFFGAKDCSILDGKVFICCGYGAINKENPIIGWRIIFLAAGPGEQIKLNTFERMANIKVKVLNTSTNALPEYATEDSAGLDLRANLTEPLTLKPMQRTLVPTGISIELPKGYEGQIRPRSGLAIKQGLTCLNSPGTIDADYRGEINVILINLSQEEQVIEHGDRIAQLVVQQYSRIGWDPVEQLSTTQRASGGFGHTGK